MAAAAFPEVAFFTFHPVLLMPNLAWLTGPSLPLENWQRALTVPLSAIWRPGYRRGAFLGFAAVRRVQDFVLAVRKDNEVVSAAEDGGLHGACRLAEEGEFRDAGRGLAARDAQAQLLGGDGAVQTPHDLVADGLSFIVDADPFAVDEGVNVEGVHTLAQADLFAQPDDVEGGGFG